jgi:hypothetical protein
MQWEAFIRAWQGSSCVAEVAKKTDYDLVTARSVANYLRGKGVPLQKFKKRIETDWAALAKLARELAPESHP